MKIKAFIRFDTYHEFVEFIEFIQLKDLVLDMEAAYPELRTVEVVFEGCDDE